MRSYIFFCARARPYRGSKKKEKKNLRPPKQIARRWWWCCARAGKNKAASSRDIFAHARPAHISTVYESRAICLSSTNSFPAGRGVTRARGADSIFSAHLPRDQVNHLPPAAMRSGHPPHPLAASFISTGQLASLPRDFIRLFFHPDFLSLFFFSFFIPLLHLCAQPGYTAGRLIRRALARAHFLLDFLGRSFARCARSFTRGSRFSLALGVQFAAARQKVLNCRE